jgi:hypothetical protein
MTLKQRGKRKVATYRLSVERAVSNAMLAATLLKAPDADLARVGLDQEYWRVRLGIEFGILPAPELELDWL